MAVAEILHLTVSDDASRMSSSVPDELAGRGKEAKESAEETMAHVGSTVDHEQHQGDCALTSPSPFVSPPTCPSQASSEPRTAPRRLSSPKTWPSSRY